MTDPAPSGIMRTLLVSIAATILVMGGGLVRRTAAQDASVRVTAEADPMEATPGELIVLTVRVEGAPASVVQRPSPPAASNLIFQDRTLRPQGYGAGSARGVAFRWRYRAQESGTATVNPVTVVVRGRMYRTERIQIRVVEPPQYPSAPTLSRPDGPSGASGAARLDSRDLFIRATPTSSRAVENEQVVVEYRLYYRPGVRLRHSRLADAWDAPGFWREELDVASRPIPRTRRAHGQSYQTIVLKRVALFPTRPGELHVDPLRVEAEAQATVRGRGGGTYRSRFQPVRLASRALAVSVSDLPSGAPPAFDGAVGQFGMSVELSEDSTRVGAPVRLRVQVQGTGNLATLAAPRFESPSQVETYEPEIETTLDRSGQRIGGGKTFSYTLVPHSGGPHTIPAVTFAYFDPNTRRYETLRSDARRLHVTGTAAREVVGRTGDGLPVGDITGLAPSEQAEWGAATPQPLYRRGWAYLALLLPVLAAGGAIVYRRRFSATPEVDASERAGTEASEEDRLRDARSHLQDGNDDAVYAAVQRAIASLLKERLDGVSLADRRDELTTRLVRADVSSELRAELFEVLDACEQARFSRSGSSPSPGAVVADADRILERLDAALVE